MKPKRSFYFGTEEAGLPDLPAGARWLPIPSGQRPPRIERLLLNWCGTERPVKQWAPEVRIKADTLYSRIVSRGWEVHEAMTLRFGAYDRDPQAELLFRVRRELPDLVWEFKCWMASGSISPWG